MSGSSMATPKTSPVGRRSTRRDAAHRRRPGSLASKLLVPIAVVSFVLLAVFSYVAYERRLLAAYHEARLVAEAIQRQVTADRRYYTQRVVPVANQVHLEVTNHYREPGRLAIPLPTTFVREVSDDLSSTATGTDYKLAMLSLFPVNPRKGPRNEIERELMKVNFKDVKPQDHRLSTDQAEFYTLYVPDIANAQSCVTCHNALPESPKRNYVLGDVMGSLAITIPMTDRLRQVKTGSLQEVSAFAAILVLAGGLIYYRAQSAVLRPLRRLASAATEMSAGNLSARVKIESDDEVGQLGQSFVGMCATVRQVVDREVASRQALDHRITEYLRFLEGVERGDLAHRLRTAESGDPDLHLGELGKRIDRLVDQLGQLAAYAKVAGERLGATPLPEGAELRSLAERLRQAAARYHF
jgi:HAMP domain-containing protein